MFSYRAGWAPLLNPGRNFRNAPRDDVLAASQWPSGLAQPEQNDWDWDLQASCVFLAGARAFLPG